MDTFFEQIVREQKSFGKLFVQVGLWVFGIALGLFILYIFFGLFMLGALFAGFLWYGVFRLSCLFNIEYEYSMTNGYFDIDKIIAKRSRKRLISTECREFDSFGRYVPAEHTGRSYSRRILAGRTSTGDGLWYAVINKPDEGKVLIVFEPNDRLLGAMKKFLPPLVARYAFSGN